MPKTLLEILNLSTEYLEQKGVKNPRKEAQEILCDVLNLERMQLYLDFERPLIEPELDSIRKRISRRAKGEPLAYIHGEVDFHGCKIKVNPSVLIPRQETGVLVEMVHRHLQKEKCQGKELWDVCTGSGCIGIALKKKNPNLKVVLSDIDRGALSVAKQNAENNQVEVELLQGDLLQPFKGKKTDFVVCNPPYVSEPEFPSLEKEVKDHEPKGALVSGNTGLEMYRRLAQQLPEYLRPKASVWMEIGDGQGKAVQEIFQNPIWKKTRVENDWSRRERFFLLEIE